MQQLKVCKSLYHGIIHINHQPDATIFQFIILTFIYSSTCFGRFPAHRQELDDCSGSIWLKPETCWAVNKRQDNKLKNCCIWLVIYLNYTMMQELTKLKLLHLVGYWISIRCNSFSSFITWRLCTAQHVSGVLTPIIRSSTTAVAASGFTFGAWW